MYYFVVKLHVRYFEELFILKNLSKFLFFPFFIYFFIYQNALSRYFVIQLTFSFKDYVVNVIFLT